MIELEKRISNSVGYKNVMMALKGVFADYFTVIEIFPTDDTTSFDFRSNMNILQVSGIDIVVHSSGNSHQFQLGAGIVSIAVPVANGFLKLPSGKQGESLDDVVGDNIPSGASADNLDKIIQLFTELKKYLENQ